MIQVFGEGQTNPPMVDWTVMWNLFSNLGQPKEYKATVGRNLNVFLHNHRITVMTMDMTFAWLEDRNHHGYHCHCMSLQSLNMKEFGIVWLIPPAAKILKGGGVAWQ